MIQNHDYNKITGVILTVALSMWTVAVFFGRAWFERVDRDIERLDERLRRVEVVDVLKKR